MWLEIFMRCTHEPTTLGNSLPSLAVPPVCLSIVLIKTSLLAKPLEAVSQSESHNPATIGPSRDLTPACPCLRGDAVRIGGGFAEPAVGPHVAETWPLALAVGCIGGDVLSTSFDIHAGSRCLFPCVCCYDRIMQDGSRAARMPRTLLYKQKMAALYGVGLRPTIVEPPVAASTLFDERRQLMVFAPEDMSPMPSHNTPGVSPWMLSLGVEAVAFDLGA